MPTTRTSAVLAFVVASLLYLGAPCGAAQPIVGDANGDGAFDVGDVAFAMNALRFSSQRPYPLADVALPCSGILEPVDGQRLLGAWLAAQDAITVRSRCHGQILPGPGSRWGPTASRAGAPGRCSSGRRITSAAAAVAPP